MARDANNLDELFSMIEKEATKAMQKGNSSVKRTVIAEGQKQVQETVYNVYTPKIYRRSGDLKYSWETENLPDGIFVYNNREDEETGKDIATTVEYARGYDYKFDFSNKPRPFTGNTIKSLERDNRLEDAFREDLRANGLDVE